MPIYEYRCDSCGFQKEYIQRMSDPQLTDCPECKKPTFSKMVTAAGFQLKGGGWYVTDFKGGGSNTGGAKKNRRKTIGYEFQVGKCRDRFRKNGKAQVGNCSNPEQHAGRFGLELSASRFSAAKSA